MEPCSVDPVRHQEKGHHSGHPKNPEQKKLEKPFNGLTPEFRTTHF